MNKQIILVIQQFGLWVIKRLYINRSLLLSASCCLYPDFPQSFPLQHLLSWVILQTLLQSPSILTLFPSSFPWFPGYFPLSNLSPDYTLKTPLLDLSNTFGTKLASLSLYMSSLSTQQFHLLKQSAF